MFSRIYAVARNTVSQAVRMKVAFVLILFLLIVLPVLPYLLKSDDTQKGEVQIVLTYSMIISSFLLSILTIFLSCAVLSSEIRGKQIHILDSKPISRWEILLGKWLGVMVIDFALLLFMGIVIYGLVVFLARPERSKNDTDQVILRSEVLLARKAVKPAPPEIDEEQVDKMYRQMLLERTREEIPEDKTKHILREGLKRRTQVVAPRHRKTWKFQVNPNPKRPDMPFVLRFCILDSASTPDQVFRAQWVIHNPDTDRLFIGREWDYVTEKNHHLLIPGQIIGDTGNLEVTFVNLEMQIRSVMFPQEEHRGLVILYPEGSFIGNYARSLALIFSRLCFLAIVGIMASTFLSFPVAALFNLTIYLFGYSAEFIVDLIQKNPLKEYRIEGVTEGIEVLSLGQGLILRILVFLFPNLTRYNPVGKVTTGIMVEWTMLLSGVFLLVVVYGGVAAIIGYLIFNNRELAGTARD